MTAGPPSSATLTELVATADHAAHFTALEGNARLHDAFHGIGGPLHVSDPGHITTRTQDFSLAAQGLGHTLQPRFQRRTQLGVGIMQHTYGQWGRYKAPLRRHESLPRPADATTRA